MKDKHKLLSLETKLTGTFIAKSWWRKITLPTGKPDFIAIMLLGEIFYWYRNNEQTQVIAGYKATTYDSDKLQRNYQSFADQFGISKKQVAEALKRLASKGIIDMDFRTITINHLTLSNVLFIGLNLDCLFNISCDSDMKCK